LLVRILRLWPFLAIVLIALAAYGWQRQSTGGASGWQLNGAISPAAAAQVRSDGRFRVGIYNIQGAVGKDDAAIARIGQIIADTDICGLTEVRANALSRAPNQAQQIGERLCRAWLFAPAERRFWMDLGGNGVVTRLPAGPWTRLPLPTGGYSDANRNIVLLRVLVANQPVNVLVAHLDRGPARAAQFVALTHLFQTLEGPLVLLADLNAEPADAEMLPLMATPWTLDPIAHFLKTKDKRVDWILTKGVDAVAAGKVEDPVSDHSFFWVDLQLLSVGPAPATRPTSRGLFP
jgi:endonuclease/exonuclease/phosphatase family metal-dependent hydrolase